jgi:hypothetical protein
MPTNAEKRKLKQLKEARERIRQRKVIVIPPKNDISLFQKQNCIESLPIPVFKMIQGYSGSETDYRNLMNTNLSTFQPMKWETVRYSFLGPGMWTRMNQYTAEYKEASIVNIIQGVKDKSKQISVSFWNVRQHTVIKYAHLFEGLHKFHFGSPNACRFTEQLSFDIFNNIHYLILERITGIPNLSSGLRNVVKLELLHCGFITISEINPTKTLKELKIITAGHLNIPCSLDNISKIQLDCESFGVNNDVAFPKNCRNLELACDAPVQMRCFDSGFDGNQPYEKLVCLGFCIENHLTAFTILQRYPVIKLENYHDTVPFPSFPVLHSTEISLYRFSLTLWNSQTITGLKELNLEFCIDLITFPDMPEVEILFIDNCEEFTEIPSLRSLRKLTILDCPMVRSICYCPELKEANFDNCPRLDNLSSCKHANFLRIRSGSKTMDLSPLAGIPSENMNLESPVNRRALSIGSCPSLKVFIFCKNLYEVELFDLSGVITCKEIMNIHHLKIRYCRRFASTDGLRNITGSVLFEVCPALQRLFGMQNIPEIVLCGCDKIRDFSGLGNHEILTMKRSNLRYFIEFQKENPDIFKTIQKLIIE